MTDAYCGKLLDALEAQGFAENTIVVFSADNGPERITYNRFKTTGHWSSGPLRGIKRELYEGGHRVPFLIKWPGVIQPGSVSDETVSQVDLAATFASIIDYDLQPSDAIDSYDMLPVLKGGQLTAPVRLATVQNSNPHMYALRQGDWIYIDAETGHEAKVPAEYLKSQGYETTTTPGLLYNLKTDLGQRNNLYAKYPERVAEMKALLDRYRNGEACAPHATEKERKR
jgi:arylsulfatase A